MSEALGLDKAICFGRRGIVGCMNELALSKVFINCFYWILNVEKFILSCSSLKLATLNLKNPHKFFDFIPLPE